MCMVCNCIFYSKCVNYIGCNTDTRLLFKCNLKLEYIIIVANNMFVRIICMLFNPMVHGQQIITTDDQFVLHAEYTKFAIVPLPTS